MPSRAVALLAGGASLSLLFGAGSAFASAPGSLVSSFGIGGSVVASFGPDTPPSSDAEGVAVAPNGDLYVAGVAAISGTGGSTINEIFIARYRSDGSLDTSFGTGGVTYENVGVGGTPQTGVFSGPEPSTYLTLTPGGNPVVATQATTTTTGHWQLAVLEFTSTGALNTSFGSGGVYRVNLGTSTTAGGVAAQSDGDLVVTGGVALGGGEPEFFATRLTAAGAVDSSFGSAGVEELQRGGSTAPTQGFGVLAQSNGDLVFAGAGQDSHGNQLFAVTRLTASGQPDTTFGSGGTAYVQASTAPVVGSEGFGLASTPDGGYAIAGYAVTSVPFPPIAVAVVRLTPSGQPDTAFGSGGTAVLADRSLLESYGNAVIPQADGKLLVIGTGVAGSAGPMVTMFNADGTVDTGFGLNGFAIDGINGSSGLSAGVAFGAAPVPGANVVVAGEGTPLSGSGPYGSFLQEISVDSAPRLSFSYAPAVAAVGVPVQFFGTAIPDPAQSITQVSWDFGSGNFGAATGANVTQTFGQPGTYTVRVQATDGFGLSTIASQAITVVGPSLRVGPIAVDSAGLHVKLSCRTAVCDVNAGLVTVEHLHGRKVTSLTASGHGKHTKRVGIGSAKLSITAASSKTITLKLNSTGRRLLGRFHKIPARASFTLTDDNGKTLQRTVKIH